MGVIVLAAFLIMAIGVVGDMAVGAPTSKSVLLYFLTSVAVLVVAIPSYFVGLAHGRRTDRTLTIYQMQSTGTYIGQFQIDASQLPPGAIKTRVDSGSQQVPVTSLTIDQRYPIRVVLVPATVDTPSPQHPAPQKKP
jgi:hypothetical protein